MNSLSCCVCDLVLYCVFILSGYYCPASTRYSSQYPCPTGTFGNVTGMQAVGDCILCPGGYYCDMTAQTTYTQICQAGSVPES